MRPGRRPGSPAAVTVVSQPVWRVRVVRESPRYLLYLTCLAGLLASVRFLIAPPSPRPPTATRPPGYREDLAAEGFAALFARRYLDWNAAEPQAHATEVADLAGRAAEPVDVRLPASGEQRVLWTQVVQTRVSQPGVHVYTVAAETDAVGLLYITVPVARLADGRLALAG